MQNSLFNPTRALFNVGEGVNVKPRKSACFQPVRALAVAVNHKGAFALFGKRKPQLYRAGGCARPALCAGYVYNLGHMTNFL